MPYQLAMSATTIRMYRVVNSETHEVVTVDMPLDVAMLALDVKRHEDTVLAQMFETPTVTAEGDWV